MSKKSVAYLKNNKDKYSLEALKAQLKKTGYDDKDIEESIKVVYESGEVKVKTSFWNFRDKKTYVTKGEKVLDFLFGIIFQSFLAIMWLFGSIMEILNLVFYYYLSAQFNLGGIWRPIVGIFLIAVIVFFTFLLFYFRERRRFIFRGQIAALIIIAILGSLALYLIGLMLHSHFRF